MQLRSLALAPLLVTTVLTVPATAPPGPATAVARSAAAVPGFAQVRVPGAEYAVSARLADLTTGGTRLTGHTDPADWAGLEAPGPRPRPGSPARRSTAASPTPPRATRTTAGSTTASSSSGCPTTGTAGWSSRVRRGCASSTPTTGSSATRSSRRDTPTPPPTRGTPAPRCTRTGNGPATPSWSGTAGSPNSPSPPSGWRSGTTVARPASRTPRACPRAATSCAGNWSTGPTSTPAASTGTPSSSPPAEACSPPFRPPSAPIPASFRATPPPGPQCWAAGYPEGSERQWGWHHRNQCDLLQRVVRELDPDYDGSVRAGTPFCPEGTGAGCGTGYDFASRPRAVHRAVERISLSGDIRRPLVSIQSGLDALTPPAAFGDVYHRMVTEAGRGALQRYTVVPGGAHTDGLVPLDEDHLRPMLGRFTAALGELESWTWPRS